MDNIVSLAARRQQKLRAKLCGFAERQEAAVIETRSGMTTAMRIFCRDAVVVLIDKFGCQTMLHYDQITDASPLLPIAEIAGKAEWQSATEAEIDANRVLFFPHASHRA